MLRRFWPIIGWLIVVALTAILVSPAVPSAPTLHSKKVACAAAFAVVSVFSPKDMFFSEKLELLTQSLTQQHPTLAFLPLLC